MKDIGSGFAHLSPVGIGVQSVITNHHLSIYSKICDKSFDHHEGKCYYPLQSRFVYERITSVVHGSISISVIY